MAVSAAGNVAAALCISRVPLGATNGMVAGGREEDAAGRGEGCDAAVDFVGTAAREYCNCRRALMVSIKCATGALSLKR